MDTLWSLVLGWLARLTLAGGLVLLIALLAQRWVKQPARRQRLGECGLAAAFLAAGLAWLPAWVIVAWPTAPAVENPRPEVAWEPMLLEMVPLEDAFLPPLAEATETLPLPKGALALAQADEPAPAAVPSAAAVDLLAWAAPGLCVLYALGAVFFAVRWLLGYVALHRLVRTSKEPAARVLHWFRQQPGWGQRRPRLLVSPKLHAPLSFGVLRPTVVIPLSLCRPEKRERLSWAFGHELAHLERRDALSALLFALGQVVFFFLPWFWQLRRQVRLCQEFVADAAALQHAPADDYAEFLLSFTAAPRLPQAAAGVSGNASDLYRRVTMLLTNRQRVEGRCPRWWAFAAAGGLLALACVLGGVGWAGAQEADRIIVVGQGTQVVPAQNAIPFKLTPVPGQPGVFMFEAGNPEHKPQVKKLDFGFEIVGEPKIIQKKGPDGTIQIELVFPGQQPKQPKDPKQEGGFHFDLVLPVQPGVPGKKIELKPGAMQIEKFEMATPAPGVDVERLKKILEKLQKQDQVDVPALRKELAEALQGKGPGPKFIFRLHNAGNVREQLGVKLAKPVEALADQLNLPRGQGLLVTEVKKESPAGAGGLKVNDVIVKVQDKAVSDDVEAFFHLLGDRKEVDLVVLRKGKEETVRGLKLPASGNVVNFMKDRPGWQPGIQVVPFPGGNVPGAGMAPPGGFQPWAQVGGLPGAPGQQGVMTTTFRTNERFNTRHQEGNLIITVTGKMEKGSTVVQEIQIQDGQVVNRYENVDRVPAAYRDKVHHLLKVSKGPAVD